MLCRSLTLSAAALFGLLLLTPCLPAQTPAPGHGVDVSTIDPSMSPCQDFYQYANGKWLADNPVLADKATWGGFSEISERNTDVLHTILDSLVAAPPAAPGSVTRKVTDFYKSGMDTARIQQQGTKPLANEFTRIDAVRDVPSLEAEIAHLHALGIGTAWNFGVGADDKDSTQNIAQLEQGGLGLPDRDYYLLPDAKSQATRADYAAHIARMFVLLGDNPTAAARESGVVIGIETRLARASMTRVERRDPNATYHKMTLAALDKTTPGISWKPYFAALGTAKPGSLLVGQPAFFAEAGRMLQTVPLADWKTYLHWDLIHGTAAYLSDDFVSENFAFYGTNISGTKEQRPRWKRVLGATDVALGEGLGQIYVARAFSPEAKARALMLVENVKAALRDRLATLDWIGPDTRRQALNKLDHMSVKIGYPDHWRDYSALSADSTDYVTNVLAAKRFEFERELHHLGQPVDRSEWAMTPPTVNAYYRPSFNEIVFPAGILQPPFFDPEADDASNYGAIGAVMGHEMTHGFDDKGRQFDAQGNLRDWWTASDRKNFQARADLIVKQFDAYVPIEDKHINGQLTQGENIADLGGLKIAYLAFEKAGETERRRMIDGFTPEQRFFLAYAQAWRANIRPEALRLRLATDPHSPNKYRVLGPLANLPEFAQAFPCPPGMADKAAAAARVSIWSETYPGSFLTTPPETGRVGLCRFGWLWLLV